MNYHPSQVMISKTLKSGAVYRRRKNTETGKVFTTYETPNLANITVIKKSGIKQKFDIFKLFGTIYISFTDEKGKNLKHCVKNGKLVLTGLIEHIIDSQQNEITTKDLAFLVLKLMKKIDYYASMRYGSRYVK
jgi:transcriptional regulator NrdR family protein